MNCLYCDEKINKITLNELLFEEDKLCEKCRKKMPLKRRVTKIEDLTIETFYDYDSLFKSILIQYKECYDEALKEVFLFQIKDYLKIKYHNYKIVYMPSTKQKLKERGFNHIEEIFKELDLEEIKGLNQIDELIQEGKSRRQRLKMKGNFVYNGPYEKRILIVDDVMTTGSSVIGVYKALKDKCGIIKAVVLSK